MSRTSDRPARQPLGLTPTTWALIVSIVLGMACAGAAIGLLMRDRDAAREETAVVAGQSKQLVECVRDETTDDCETEADEVAETIGEAGDPGPAGSDGTDGVDGRDGVDGAPGPRGPAGAPGQRGPRGFIGPVGPAGPPGADGSDGTSGADGTPGPVGPAGPAGPQGDRGPAGPSGPAGAAGTARPGTYTCPDGQYAAGLTVGDAGGVTLDCRDLPALLPTPEEPT